VPESRESIIVNKPKKRKRRTGGTKNLGLFAFTVLIMAVIVLTAYSYFFPKEEKFVLNFYTFAEVGTMDFIDRISASGTITPKTIVEIKAEAAAAVTEILVNEGDDVAAGDLLMQLHSPSLHDAQIKAAADLDAAEKALEQLTDDQAYELITAQDKIAKAEQDLAAKQANLQLQRKLYDFGVIARVELEKAEQEAAAAKQALLTAERDLTKLLRTHENALEQAQKNLADAQAELQSVTEKINSLTVRAPISGRVLAINTKPGTDVKEADKLISIADLTTQFIKSSVSVAQAERFTVGTPAEITVGQTSYPAVVSYIAPQAHQSQDGALVDVHLEFQDKAAEFRPYSNVTANIHLGIYRSSMYLPRGAYLTSGQQLFVYVIEGDRAVQRDVQFGLIQGNNIQVLSGLEVGEKVITSSYDQFRHLEAIEILPEGGRAL
jgi:HlyD family secretion protein